MGNKIIVTVEGVPVGLNDKNQLTFTAKMAIDDDGQKNPDKDPDHQNDTNLHWQGKPLDATIDKYIVLPIFLFKLFAPIGLGSMCFLRNTRNGKTTYAVVGDKGPNKKIGEASPPVAEALGLDGNSLHGGTDAHEIEYTVELGVPALVDGKQFELQPS